MKIVGAFMIIFAVCSSFGAETDISADYFVQMTKVLQSPRCLNCHPGDDRPHQGDDMHIHSMNVLRGPHDHGHVGERCATCHQEANNSVSGIPGAPKWGLAPASMHWMDLDKHDLCMALKDTQKTHGMTLVQMIDHNGNDPLVGWAWHPGANRKPAPGSQKQFGELTAKWVNSGAHCPP